MSDIGCLDSACCESETQESDSAGARGATDSLIEPVDSESCVQGSRAGFPVAGSDGAWTGEPSESIEAITLDDVAAKLDELAQLFRAKIERSEYELHVSKKMSEEVERGRDDLFRQLTAPLVSALASLHADAEKTFRHYEAERESVPLRVFEMHVDDIGDVLAEYGVEIDRPLAGDLFESGRCRIVGSPVPTSDPALDRTIMEVRTSGYAMGGRILMPAKVRVYRFDNDAQGTEAEEMRVASE